MLWSAGESCVKHLKTLGNIKTISATNCSCSYVKYMVNGGNLWLLNNVSPDFHISGVCSDICSFNRILRQFWILHTRFDGDVINSAVNSTTLFIVSPSTVYNGVTVWHTSSLNCCRLVDTTELWAPERPDTGTVSSPKQSISWTLDIKRGTHNTIIHYLFITHTYFSCQICTYQTCTHIIVYIIYCVFVHCLFVYYSFIICRVAVILWHCGASVTITNSLCV